MDAFEREYNENAGSVFDWDVAAQTVFALFIGCLFAGAIYTAINMG